ncbi:MULTISPECIES: beta-ketoacyl-[acyl-carrier-protein] synthase family protein [Mesorhizobium]|uniref:Nodulation protein E n=1 Tax=Mesorhizobium album TaxID=3072314 RepID=A0ABU4Y5C7_9HYPH|nr:MULTISPECIES: beta-ketoacyl-[acyl-carrier-protein] synthase family protein [unclassified Mesorhizobium]MDX8482147.1 beta-ketoacyl-[acyl-carrier-protein] synthase family protein [Mesorhizobium sp. VK24D]MDX8515692.1 beta-ketoacyl-[acyl-carrier-protein] synthase family protein [Mesorhizobium sp. VK23E]
MNKRVVITGIGGICGLGSCAADIWAAMCDGRSAIGVLSGPSLHDITARTGCAIRNLPQHQIERKQVLSMDRFSVLAVLAAREAVQQAGLTASDKNRYRLGATVGVGVCGWEAIEQDYRSMLLHGRKRTGAFTAPKVMPGAAAGHVSMDLGLRGPVYGVTSACSSSNHAIASAVDQIRWGRADVMVAGGADAPLVWGVVKSWEAMRVLSPDTCRPFSANRQGAVLGEGAGMIVLESYDHARARGAEILAELAGAGLSADAFDIAAQTIEGPEAAIRACLADAGLVPEEVDYLNAHGTGTKPNDQIETAAIKRAFGDHAYRMSVSSTKSMHAHCLGASGALELIACVMAIRHGIVPPTANYDQPDPDCDLDVTPNVARERKVKVTLSNSFAFAGTNAVLAIKAA